MLKLPKKGRPGEELKWAWLNELRDAVARCQLVFGPNCGLQAVWCLRHWRFECVFRSLDNLPL